MQLESEVRQKWHFVGEDEALLGFLEGLLREAERHAAAAGLVEAVVAPDVAACAAAGLNSAHIEVKRTLTQSHRITCSFQVPVPCLSYLL